MATINYSAVLDVGIIGLPSLATMKHLSGLKLTYIPSILSLVVLAIILAIHIHSLNDLIHSLCPQT